MGYSEYDKYHEVLICSACKAVYIEGDGCPNYCLECEACKEMTKLNDLDPTLLIEAQAEICHDCADEFLDELASHVLEDLDYKTKYPNREDLGLGEFKAGVLQSLHSGKSTKAKDGLYLSTGMVMGDYKGRV